MKINNLNIFIALFVILLTSCSKDDEVLEEGLTDIDPKAEGITEPGEIEVEEFVWKGLNDIYLYKEDISELSDDYFSSNIEKSEYLETFGSPEELFGELKSSRDRFSFITSDYNELEDSFNGITSSTAGMNFGLGRISGSNNIFGFLQYVVPGTSAADAGLTRGIVFTEINGERMTLDNFQDLMDVDSFDIKTAKIENGSIIPTGETVTLSNSSYTSNPVQVVKTLDVEGKKVGYLMYNSFIGDFDDELNDAFAQFKGSGITDLVLDLRYNGGGSVESAIDLASMITGQFEGEIFMKEQWNKDYQEHFERNNAEGLINRFDGKIRTGEALNSLNLNRVYVLTTNSTASASELVINGLKPYINVVQIGESTTGKFQASVTLYDSPNFQKEGASENHTYALQPLVFKSANAAGYSDYENGLVPEIEYTEEVDNLGTLGDPSEPMLEAALNHLLGKAQVAHKQQNDNIEKVGESGMFKAGYQKMYLDAVPEVLLKRAEEKNQ
ncbi:S41 family peptidase [Autumnicola psychrophila]|uniref:S41 family peptidase n=1 Tax=Autumnicola psychrophila TaxID=3075592 RepID=A0ABU3DQE3_9FLAO|nr:S41 family peptidase [Zunongwangia sp. F225]MDT0685938.1 S41 family peptidase [Zunongwangia sp. F225]